MLASNPASMVNQKQADLGIPNRFNLTPSRFRRRQDFRQSPPPGQALEMGSCNIAAAKIDLQGLGRDRRSAQLEERSPERR